MNNDTEGIQRVLVESLNQADVRTYSGYSKFDGLMSPLTQRLSFGCWPLRLFWSQIVMRSPWNIRPLLRVPPGINPEAPALFARANLTCSELGFPGAFAQRAHGCLDWLLENDASKRYAFHGRCWGYHHPWQSPGFYQPPHYPNCYMTVIVGGALVHGYRVSGDRRYLEGARSAVEFILQDLPVFYETADEKCLGYVPTMRIKLQVININALAAAFIAKVGAETGESALIDQAGKLMRFVVNQQTPAGAWYYTVDPKQALVTHDNYHTGMILDALMEYEQATGNAQFRSQFLVGLDFYRNHLFLPNGAPKWTNTKQYPFDVHGSAQGTLTFSLAGDRDMALRIALWGINTFYKGNGNFGYQQTRWQSKQFTLLHWCNGWMARGLSALLACA